MTVLDFARLQEESGLAFYREMAERSGEDGVKKVFHMLAQDQAGLIGRLRRLQERFGEADREFDTALIDRTINIFEKLRSKEDRLAVGDDLEAYRLAIDAEEEVIDQYRKAIEGTDDPGMKRLLTRIMALDRQELEDVRQLYDFVNAPSDSLEWGEFSNLDEFHNFGRYEDLRQGSLDDPVIPEPERH